MAKKIVVVGSFVADLMGRCPHLPKPGETVKGSAFRAGPGGKGANQGVAAKRAGADVEMVTKIGSDDFGEMARRNFEKEGFSTKYILEDGRYDTGAALIMVDENTSENEILVYSGACDHMEEADIRRISPLLSGTDILLVQLEINTDAVEACLRIAKEGGAYTVLNPAPVQQIPDHFYEMTDLITPNEVEASILSGVEVIDEETARKAAEWFHSKGVDTVIITLGARGAYVKTADSEYMVPACDVDVVDTTGAGDAFNGGLVTALAEGMELRDAVRFAGAAAGLSVTRIGTAPAMPYRKEIDAFLKTRSQP